MAWALVIALSSPEVVGMNRPLSRPAVLTKSRQDLPSPRSRLGAGQDPHPPPAEKRQSGGSARTGGWDGDTGYQGAVCDFKVKGRVLIRTESRDYLHVPVPRMQSSAGPPAPGWAEPAGGGAGSGDSPGV